MIETEDFHPNDGHPHWNESAWFSFAIPEREINGWVYFWHRPNMGASFGGFCLWDKSSPNPMDCLYYEFDQHPVTDARRVHDFTWVTGLSAQCVKSQDHYRFLYKNDYCFAELDWHAFMPPHVSVFNKDSFGDFGVGHYDQGGKMVGTINVAGETFAIDCMSLRDRSWGPRHRSSIPRANYSWAIASETSSFCLGAQVMGSGIGDPVIGTTETITYGHYTKDGLVGNVSSGSRRVTERAADGRPLKIELDAVDDLGREVKVKGTCTAWLRFPGLTFLAYWWSMVRWEFDGAVVYGEEQEGWGMQHYRRFQRARIEGRA